MSIRAQLKNDLNTNLKARNELETTTLRNIIGTIQTQEKSGKTEVTFTDVEIVNLISKEVKKRRDTAEEFTRVNALDRAVRETAEADFLQTYLPELPTEENMLATVNSILSEYDSPSMRDMGAIMKAVSSVYEGIPIDGKFVSTAVRERLS